MDHQCHSPPPRSIFLFLILTLIIITVFSNFTSAQILEEDSIANLNRTWVNNSSTPLRDMNSMKFQPILTRRTGTGNSGPWFSCGFFCNTDSECLFALLLFPNSSMTQYSKLVWSANRNNPVSFGATLALDGGGNLVLKHGNGSLVWRTYPSGKSISGLNLTELGNLVLFDRNKAIIWQSFDYPTDCLLPGQMLVSGKMLISNASSTDWREGLYSLSIANQKLVAYMELGSSTASNGQQPYYESNTDIKIPNDKTGRAYIRYEGGSFGGVNFSIASPLTAQFMRLETDGHVKFYEWIGSDWKEVSDFLTPLILDCGYPMVCGNYGICSGKGQCTCPRPAVGEKSYFKEKEERQPNLGCSLNTPISCNYSQFHSFVELNNISYSSLSKSISIGETDFEYCKKRCMERCFCKAAVFQYNQWYPRNGSCYLLPVVFSFINSGQANLSVAYVKVQNPPKKERKTIILEASVGALIGAFFTIRNILFFIWDRNASKEVEENGYFEQVPGTPARFSYQHLRDLTEDFSRKLGEGGFGTVFEGTFHNGTKVAVKRLDKLDLVEKTFLAEVETIGNIHHVNLVRLIGFCIEKSHRLLVYEYMSNGSLDKWIFSKNQAFSLRWQYRRKIILEIAKGLAYLHEGCRQKIFHLDIKPQNILLDENFNAKLADFGLSKLIDKDQSKVVTTIKGTPGYMAPEWLSSFITEKVDVYSFGVVVLEILCGRRNLDRSQPDEDMHLLSLFKRKANAEQLLDMVDKCSEDMQLHGAEVVNMMKVAAWCLQNDFERRPSMTLVVQVLEFGLLNIGDNLDYNFTNQQLPTRTISDEDEQHVGSTTLLLPSILSGPR